MRFEEFTAARLPALLRFAFLLCGDRELARDLVQEALTKALVRWSRVDAADQPYAYVRTMLTNEFLAFHRRRRLRTVPLTSDLAPTEPAAADGLDDRDELWRQLAGLPRQQRAVLVLRYYEDLSDAEIAEVLRCREGTVRGYAARAFATLRVELAQRLEDEASHSGGSTR
jgi:RNA polymerase sigma-70 factor (sigma-E family)